MTTATLGRPRRDDGDRAAGDCAGGDRAGAEADWRRMLDIDPGRPDALLGLAVLLLQRGEPARAQLLLLRCCGVAPTCVAAWAALGLALLGTGDAREAEAAYAEAQALAPENLELALRRVGAALHAGDGAAELARLDVATMRDPLDIVQLTARGVLLERLGRREEAVDILEAAVVLAPEAAGPAIELANALIHTERHAAAETALRHAIALAPGQWLLRNNRAVILMRLHRWREAHDEFAALIDSHGELPAILCNLSTVLSALGAQDAAVAAACRAAALAPDLHLARRAIANALAYRDGVSGAEMLRACADASACLPRSAAITRTRKPVGKHRLRVGLLSTMLKTHPVGWLTVAGVENLDPAEFEIVCIGQPESGDPIARRFRAVAAEWHVASGGDAAAIAAQVRTLGIDVLLDLSGYGDRGLMAACAHRGAPVQVKWVGMQNHSSGLPEMDFFLTDRWETPPGFEPLYSERLLRLPDGYVCYSPPPYAPDIRTLPAAALGRVTFGCFNNLAKISPRAVATWAEILRRVGGSRLVLKTHQFDDATTAGRMLAQFAAHGIEPPRIELRGGSPHRVLLDQYNDIDIVLDPFPYTGGLTTCEALWMGVPTVTLAGEIFAARHAASHLSNVGLPDWVTTDTEAYMAMAVARARNLPALAGLRAGLRARVKASALCDAPRFGRSLGAALRLAWQSEPAA